MKTFNIWIILLNVIQTFSIPISVLQYNFCKNCKELFKKTIINPCIQEDYISCSHIRQCEEMCNLKYDKKNKIRRKKLYNT